MGRKKKQPKPVDLASVKELIPNGPPHHHASALLDLNGSLTATETILLGLRDLAAELGPLSSTFFHRAIHERRGRHGRFIDDLMSGKLDDV